MNFTMIDHTPHGTIRLFIPNRIVNTLTHTEIKFLDCFSVWGGSDHKSSEYRSWEFKKDVEFALNRLVDFLNTK